MSSRIEVPHKEARKLVSYARELGYEVEISGASHLRFVHTENGAVVVAATTPRVRSYVRTYRRLVKSLPKGHPRANDPPRRS